jgi:hypothetical protein
LFASTLGLFQQNRPIAAMSIGIGSGPQIGVQKGL